MTNEKLERANLLKDVIEDVEECLSNCNSMIEEPNTRISISAHDYNNVSFLVPKEITADILQRSKEGLERQLADLKKEFSEL